MSASNEIEHIPQTLPSRLGSWLFLPALTLAGLLAAGSAADLAGGDTARALQTSGNPDQMPPASPEARRDPLATVLGGFAPTAANIAWLQGFDASIDDNWNDSGRLFLQACRLSPRSRFFWTQAAQMLAYNFPSALAKREEKRLKRQLTLGELAALRDRGGRRAIQLLEESLAWHPNHPRILVQMAMIHLSVREDERSALPLLKLASAQPEAPYHAARIYAEVLRRQGRPREAYDWYRNLHPTLPKDVLAANADVVLERIRELEAELKIPSSESYQPQ